MSLRPLFDVDVVAVRQPAPRVREFALAAADGRALPAWEAGAHIELQVADAADPAG